MPDPRVTVLMAVYNGEKYLREAIDSILKQTFGDFEFLILNDGSTDSSPTILDEFAARDPRIVLAPNATNMGHANSLNKGLKLARGEYIARMDADDISLPNRLLRQVEFMDAHAQVGICGTWVRYLGGSNQVWSLPQSDTEIRCYMFFHSPLAHPTVMMRQRLIVEHHLSYQQAYDPAEDFGLWNEALPFTSFANLPEVLFLYRVHGSQLTAARRAKMLAAGAKIRSIQLVRMGLEVTSETSDFHSRVLALDEPVTREFVTQADTWLQKVIAANQRTGVFPEPAFSKRLGLHWLFLCRTAANLGFFAWNSFWASPLSALLQLSPSEKMKFWMLCASPWLRHFRNRRLQPA